MTHSAELSSDGSGCISRMNNALEKIPERLASAEAHLQDNLVQLKKAKGE